MESWTSIWTASPEVDLVFFDGAMVIFRVNGLPKKNSITKLREAYEQGVYSANECREYYRKYIAHSPIPYAPFTKPLNPKTELDKLIEKARWENEHSWFYRLFHRWKD